MIMDLTLQKPKSFFIYICEGAPYKVSSFFGLSDPRSALGAFLACELTDPSDAWSQETLEDNGK